MIRKIIHIDRQKCNGCGACASACHEGAIELVEGKAELVRENFCDGLGDCLPACPAGAITFEEREAPVYDQTAAQEAKRTRTGGAVSEAEGNGCPGSRMRTLNARMQQRREQESVTTGRPVSRLRQWPIQIKLVPVKAPFFDGAKLLIAADCAAYAYANLHEEFMRGRVTLIGCPKLDGVDYADKLTEIIRDNDIKGVAIVRMEVPCCGGLQRAAEQALKNSGKFLPWRVATVSLNGNILDDCRDMP